MSNCSALATKQELESLSSEVSQLQSELNGKIDREEKPEIVQAGGGLGLALAGAALSPQIRALVSKMTGLAAKLAGLAGKLLNVINLIATLATITYVTYLEYRLGRAEAKIRTLETLVGANEIEIRQLQRDLGEARTQIRQLRDDLAIAERDIGTLTENVRRANANADRAISDADAAYNEAVVAREDAARASLQAIRANIIATGAARTARENRRLVELAQASANAAQDRINTLSLQIEQLRAENRQLASQIAAQAAVTAGLRGVADAALREASTKADRTTVDEQGRTIRRVRDRTVIFNDNITALRTSVTGVESSIDRRNREVVNEVGKLKKYVDGLKNSNNTATGNGTGTTATNRGGSSLSEAKIRDIVTTEVTTQVRKQQKVNDRQYQDLTVGIAGIGTLIGSLDIPNITTRVTNIDTNVSTAVSQTKPEALTDAAAAGVCRTTKPGGCMSTNVTQPIQKNFDSLVSSAGTSFAAANNAILLRMQNVLNAVQGTVNIIRGTTEATLKTISHSKHGLAAMQEYAKTAWKVTRADKVMAGVSMVMSVHNGMMLSNNLLGTVSEATNMTLNALNIRTEEGDPINLGAMVNSKITRVLKGVIGEAEYAAITARIAKANRIYQASINLLDTTYSLFDSARTVAELTAENTGKIGNALREAGVVYEDAYNEFVEEVESQNRKLRGFGKLGKSLEGIQEGVSTATEIVSEVVELKDIVGEVRSEKQALAEEINEATEKAKTEKDEAKEEVQVTADISEIDFDKAEELTSN